MYLLSQLWLYLLLACLAGLALGLLLNRVCQQRRLAAQLAAVEVQHREERARAEAAFTSLRSEHATALAVADGERVALQSRVEMLDAEHGVTRTRALALGASVEEHHAVRSGLDTQLNALREEHESLQTTYASRLTLLNTETSRAVQLTDELAELRTRHAALDTTHRATLDEQAAVAKEAYVALVQTQHERDAAREAAAAAQAELSRERQAAGVAAGLAATAALASRQSHQDELVALEQQRAALEQQRMGLAQEHTALMRQHAVLTQQHAALGGELAASREVAAATEARLQAQWAAEREARQASTRASAEAAARDAAAAIDAVEAELSRERQAAGVAAGLAVTAALASRQSHQDELAALAQEHAGCIQERAALVAQRDRQIAELQATLADQESAWQLAERQAQELRDAQAAGQSAAQLREQAIQQELGGLQTRAQDLEVELRTLRLTLAENDEQLATLSARLQTERDQQQAAQWRIAELAALVPPPAPEVPVVVRPAVSAAATITSAELERLVLAAGAGQQPAPVEIDHQRPDDLKIIDGIGPVNERWLHAHGVHYFWQIASWSPAELAWVAHHLPNFGSRVYRENWIAQAAKLAAQPSIR